MSLITCETARIQIADSMSPIKAPRTGFYKAFNFKFVFLFTYL